MSFNTEPNRRLRVLMIGTGSIGQRHIRNIQSLCEQPSFVFYRETGHRNQLSDDVRAEIVTSLNADVLADVDLAVVANPSSLHFDVLNILLPEGVPTYIEKPVVTSMEHLQALRRMASELGKELPLLVGCNLRFLPAVNKFKSLLEDGIVGLPVKATFNVGQWLPDWRPTQEYTKSYSADKTRGGGVVMDLIHEIDMARYCFGDFEKVFSVGGKHSDLEINTEDTVLACLGRRGGPAVSIGLDYVSRCKERRYLVTGTKGSLDLDMMAKTLTFFGPADQKVSYCNKNDFEISLSYILAFEALFSAMSSQSFSALDFGDALNTVELALKIKEGIE